tara:strand:- start:119 stop:463 length:345 start_codon:yes stop_codon:yes gene_type:complete
MAKIILNKEALNKNQYQKVIDTSFTQLVQPTPVTPESIPSISVAEFFNNYQEIFFQIPKFGNINSHEYIIKTSQEYLGSDPLTDSTIQALIEEITQLRQENLDFQQQIISGTIQ